MIHTRALWKRATLKYSTHLFMERKLMGLVAETKGKGLITDTDPNKEYWYRYVDSPRSRTNCTVISMDAYPTLGINVSLEQIPVLKRTATGAVLDLGYRSRFVQDGTRKQFAHPNKEDAEKSFFYRKKAQRRILRRQLDQANAAYAVGEKMMILQQK